jgi:hypothetical protein
VWICPCGSMAIAIKKASDICKFSFIHIRIIP